jgi:MSHA biogenesis protein MshK
MDGHLKAALLACILAAAMPGYAVENLPDPTRPPAAFALPATNAAAVSGPVLQSILISSSRRHAIIDGRTVRVGDKVGGAEVVEITAGQVTLQEGGVKRVLQLFPRAEHSAGVQKIEARR